MSVDLTNKRILFIGPVFHDYHSAIIGKLRDAGADVTFFPERSYKLSFKLINNLLPDQLAAYQEKHYRKILQQTNGQHYDYLFVIRGFMLSQDFMDTFKKRYPGAQTIMYQWDSNRANPFVHLIDSFDKVISFDFEDCENHPSISYLPLFYTDDVKQVAEQHREHIEFDFFFMGWYFPERYAAVARFKEYAIEKGWKLKAFLYIPRTSLIKEKLKGTKLDYSIVSSTHMPRTEYLDILSRSRVMVDVSNPRQTGLAMRVIEALACGTKVLTNNRRLTEDKLHSSGYVAFFDDIAPVVETSFLHNVPEKQAIGVLAIGDWVKKIFEV